MMRVGLRKEEEGLGWGVMVRGEGDFTGMFVVELLDYMRMDVGTHIWNLIGILRAIQPCERA